MDNILGGIIELLQQRGHYFSSVEIVSMAVANDSADISAIVKFGPKVVIATIQCSGLGKTSPETVQKYVADINGKALTPDYIREIETRARQIPYLVFDSLSVAPLPGYSSAVVQLWFREPSAVALLGNAGYRPDDKNGLLWSFDGTLRNVIGDGRELHMNSERRDRLRNTLLLEYRQPAFWFGRGQFEARLQSRDYRDQFSEFSVGTQLSTYVDDHDLIGGALGWSRTDFADSTPEYHKYTAGVRYQSIALTDSVNPVSGYKLGWSADYQYRTYRKVADSPVVVRPSVNESRTRFRGEIYFAPFSRSHVGLIRLDLMSLFSDEQELPSSELFLLGGPGTIRGYRTDQFTARRAAICSVELRLRGKSGYFFAFSDIGYVYQQLSRGASDEIVKLGYGAGLRLIDRSKFFELGFGWNPELRFNRPQVMLKVSTGL